MSGGDVFEKSAIEYAVDVNLSAVDLLNPSVEELARQRAGDWKIIASVCGALSTVI